MSLEAACSFEDCSASIIERVVIATVDQLCAHTDIAIDLLDALEYPLGESVMAASAYGISRIAVQIVEGRLDVELHLQTTVPDARAALGDSVDVVTSFFDVHLLDGSAGLLLTGSVE